MDNLTKGLLEAGHGVKVLCASTYKHPFIPEELSVEYKKSTSIEAVYIDTKLNFVDAFSNLITRDSYNVSRFFSPDLDMMLEKILRADEFDVVQLESLFMTPYIATVRRFSKAKLILRSHNFEYKIWQRMARVSSNGPKKAYLKILANRLKDYELAIMGQVDGIATMSNEDTRHYQELGCTTPIETIPLGIDCAVYEPEFPHVFKPTLFHLGAMDWMPNIEGVNWFLKDAWKLILRDYPQLKLHLAGKASEKFTPTSRTSLVLDGEVPCAKDYMREHGIMIVPLLSGGGIRIKIIEGMALGKVIISTSIGAEGIGVEHGKNILIADTATEFKQRIDEIHEDPSILERISKNAKSFVEHQFDNSVLTAKLLRFYSGKRSIEAQLVS